MKPTLRFEHLPADVLGLSPLARAIAMSEAVLGVLFVAVIIARVLSAAPDEPVSSDGSDR